MNAIDEAIKKFGSLYRLSKNTEVSNKALYKAKRDGRIGAKLAVELESATGIPRYRFVWPDYNPGCCAKNASEKSPD